MAKPTAEELIELEAIVKKDMTAEGIPDLVNRRILALAESSEDVASLITAWKAAPTKEAKDVVLESLKETIYDFTD